MTGKKNCVLFTIKFEISFLVKGFLHNYIKQCMNYICESRVSRRKHSTGKFCAEGENESPDSFTGPLFKQCY